jgi:hypothetical protein
LRRNFNGNYDDNDWKITQPGHIRVYLPERVCCTKYKRNSSGMEFLTLDLEINPWENRSYEIIARPSQGEDKPHPGSTMAAQVFWNSARMITHFPLSNTALEARLPILRSTLAQMDLAAGRANTDEERGVTEFAILLHDFIFTGDVLRVFNQARAAAVSQWKGLRLRLRISAPDLQSVPWEVLWEILAFDLQSMRRGLFDLHIERIAPYRLRPPANFRPSAGPLHPVSSTPNHQDVLHLIRQADAAFYSPDFLIAIERYKQCLHLEPSLRQARECLARAQNCLNSHLPITTVPPRAAAGYQRAWDTYTQYRFDEALRWLNEAWPSGLRPRLFWLKLSTAAQAMRIIRRASPVLKMATWLARSKPFNRPFMSIRLRYIMPSWKTGGKSLKSERKLPHEPP